MFSKCSSTLPPVAGGSGAPRQTMVPSTATAGHVAKCTVVVALYESVSTSVTWSYAGDCTVGRLPPQLDVSLLACGAAGGPPRVVAAGQLPLQSDWLANEVDTLRNTAAAAAAGGGANAGAPGAAPVSFEADSVRVPSTAAAGSGSRSGGHEVGETMEVPLFVTAAVAAAPKRSAQAGTGAAATAAGGDATRMSLKLRLSLDVHQVGTTVPRPSPHAAACLAPRYRNARPALTP